MKKISLIFGLAILSIVIHACSFGVDCKKGDGPLSVEDRTVSTFDGIELNLAANIKLTQSPKPTLEIEANKNLLPFIKTDVEKGTLVITTKDCNCINSTDDITIRVSTPTINNININGSGEIVSTGAISTTTLNCNINGSGDIKIDDLHAENYDININGSGDVQLGGSSAKTGDININGSGDVNTSDVPTSAVAVSVSGSGDVTVKPTAAMDVTISGSGDVHYYGSPEVSSNIIGSGDLIKE